MTKLSLHVKLTQGLIHFVLFWIISDIPGCSNGRPLGDAVLQYSSSFFTFLHQRWWARLSTGEYALPTADDILIAWNVHAFSNRKAKTSPCSRFAVGDGVISTRLFACLGLMDTGTNVP
jgi:hypothetical protein